MSPAPHSGLPSAALCRILNAGDCGLVVEFGSAVDARLNGLVVALDARLRSEALPGVVETVPTYRSLLVLFDPIVLGRRELIAKLEMMSADLRPEDDSQTRRWFVPVTYGEGFGEDLDHVAALHGLTTDEVIRHHSQAEYRVYMIGFAPGFAYLGGLPELLHTPRRIDPRQRTPAGSISIGGVQAAISSVEGPSGWHLLGRTPLRTFDLAREDPFLLKPGDRVRFQPVPQAEFLRLKAMSESGAVTAEWEAAS
ncbi:5-oxoprolinase subunit PxpB [Methylocapsa sp. S129]|uniref:5-oxoprolinase subunit PxpB n=1 Tax=Methylocapsa sp. S129 TaxID=1641869 RepID=UPI00131B5C6C|nr:5-oxoprolinase subunit PxpB [Methylocapsa sp. S129]